MLFTGHHDPSQAVNPFDDPLWIWCIGHWKVLVVVIKDYECIRRRNFNTDTLNDFPI